MNNCNCTYRVYPIPENYAGQVTVGNITAFDTPVRVNFWKPGAGTYESVEATSGAAGEVVVDWQNDCFFSAFNCCYLLSIETAEFTPLQWDLSGVAYDCIELCFRECQTTDMPESIALTQDTKTPCETC